MENMQDVGNVNVSNVQSNDVKNTIDGVYPFQHHEKDYVRSADSYADSYADSLDEILQSSMEEESTGSLLCDDEFSERDHGHGHSSLLLPKAKVQLNMDYVPQVSLKGEKLFSSHTKRQEMNIMVAKNTMHVDDEKVSLKIETSQSDADLAKSRSMSTDSGMVGEKEARRSPKKVTFSDEEGSESPLRRKQPKPQLSSRMKQKLQEKKGLMKPPAPVRKLNLEKPMTVPKSPTLRTTAKHGRKVYSNSGPREEQNKSSLSSPRKNTRSNSLSPRKSPRKSSNSLSPRKKSVQHESNTPSQGFQERSFFSSSGSGIDSAPSISAYKKNEKGVTKPISPRLATLELLGQRNYSISSADGRMMKSASPVSSQRVEKLNKIATLTEMKNNFLRDFRHYSPVKERFVPKTTVPSPFSLRTEERAKLWSAPQSPEPQEKFQFKARPMPSFGESGSPLLSPNSFRQRYYTVPEPFELEIDKRMKMRMRMRTLNGSQDDNEIGRYRFKALMVPDFTYRPLGSNHEVNLTVPFPFHLKIDERLARRIRFNGTKRSNRMGRAQVSLYIQKTRSSQSSEKSSDKEQHIHDPEVMMQLSPKKPFALNSTQMSERKQKLRGQSVPKSFDSNSRKHALPRARNTRSSSIVKEVFQPPEAKKFNFKAKKMPNFSKPFVPSMARGDTPIKKMPSKSNTPIGKRSPAPNKTRPSPVGLRLRSQSSTPSKKRFPLSPRNAFSKAIKPSRTRTPSSRRRTAMLPMDIPTPVKFKAKPMPDFSRPFTPKKPTTSPPKKSVTSLRIEADAPVTRKFKTGPTSPMSDASKQQFGHIPRASPITQKPPLTNGAKVNGSPTRNYSASQMTGTSRRQVSQSPSTRVRKPPISPYHTYASPSPSKARSPPLSSSSKKFKARKMPDFSSPFVPQKRERTPSPIVLKEDSKTFIARPLPDFSKPFVPKKVSSVEKAIINAKRDKEILDVLHEKLAVYEKQAKAKDLMMGSPEKDKHLANAVVHAVLQDFLKTARTGNNAPRKISIDPRNPELQNIIRESMSVSSVSKDDLQSSLVHGSLSLSSSGSTNIGPESNALAGEENDDVPFCSVSALSSEERSIGSPEYEKMQDPVHHPAEDTSEGSLGSAEDVILSSDEIISGGSSDLLSSDSFSESFSFEGKDHADITTEMNTRYLDTSSYALEDKLISPNETENRLPIVITDLVVNLEDDRSATKITEPEVRKNSPPAYADTPPGRAKMDGNFIVPTEAMNVTSEEKCSPEESLKEEALSPKHVLSPQCRKNYVESNVSVPTESPSSSGLFIFPPKFAQEAPALQTSALSPQSRQSERGSNVSTHSENYTLSPKESAPEVAQQEDPLSPTAVRSPKRKYLQSEMDAEESASTRLIDIASYIASPKQVSVLSPQSRTVDTVPNGLTSTETPSSSGSFYHIDASDSDLSHPLMKVMERLNETMTKLNEIQEISSDEDGSQCEIPGHIATETMDPMERARIEAGAKSRVMEEGPKKTVTIEVPTSSPQGDTGDDFDPTITTAFRGGWHRAPSSPTFSEVQVIQSPPKPEVAAFASEPILKARDRHDSSGDYVPTMTDFALSIITEEQSACSSHQSHPLSEDMRGCLDIDPSGSSEDENENKTVLGADPSSSSTGESSLISDQSSGSTNVLAERVNQMLISQENLKENMRVADEDKNSSCSGSRLSIDIADPSYQTYDMMKTPKLSNKKIPKSDLPNTPPSSSRSSVFDVILNCCSPRPDRKTPRSTKTPKSNENQQLVQSYIEQEQDSCSSSNATP